MKLFGHPKAYALFMAYPDLLPCVPRWAHNPSRIRGPVSFPVDSGSESDLTVMAKAQHGRLMADAASIV